MPKFIKTISVLAVLSWIVLIFIINLLSSDSYINIFAFLIVLYVALHNTFSIPMYFYYKKRLPNFTDKRVLYRMGTKWSALISFIFVGLLFLKAFNLVNVLNCGLFLLLCIGIFFQIKGRK